jgi:hypothetical protein
MVALTRNQFFLLALLVLLSIFFAHKVVWVVGAKKAEGEVVMTGHGNLGWALGLSSYQVVKFIAGNDTIVFNGEIDLFLESGAKVNILYHTDNPEVAKINTFNSLWSESVIYCSGPLLVLIAIFLLPDIIPRNSKMVIGRGGIKLAIPDQIRNASVSETLTEKGITKKPLNNN